METIAELRQHFTDNGYAPFLTGRTADWLAVSDWRIERTATGWRVGYFERGELGETVIETDDAREAMASFVETIAAQIYHLKTFIRDPGGIRALEAALRAAGVPFQRNDVPFEGWLRVFVAGPDLRRAQAVAGMGGQAE